MTGCRWQTTWFDFFFPFLDSLFAAETGRSRKGRPVSLSPGRFFFRDLRLFPLLFPHNPCHRSGSGRLRVLCPCGPAPGPRSGRVPGPPRRSSPSRFSPPPKALPDSAPSPKAPPPCPAARHPTKAGLSFRAVFRLHRSPPLLPLTAFERLSAPTLCGRSGDLRSASLQKSPKKAPRASCPRGSLFSLSSRLCAAALTADQAHPPAALRRSPRRRCPARRSAPRCCGRQTGRRRPARSAGGSVRGAVLPPSRCRPRCR